MSIMSDFHTHTSFSGDCDTPMEKMIEKAIKIGMSHLCFTEHFDPDYPVRDGETLDFSLATDNYRKDFLYYQEKYKKQIQLLWGVELGLQSHLLTDLSEYINHFPFDFVIASSHLCNGGDPYYPDFFENRSEETVYKEYFSSIFENTKTFHDYDIYGHLDYIVRYGPNKDALYSYEKYRDIYDSILKSIIESGKGIELNTGGVKYGLKDLHPTYDVLKRYKELGGEIITIGSDAHTPENLRNHFDRAKDVLKSCGFQYYTIFQERKPQFISLK
ncbi:MAG: histidinol-phosphatase HisJ family protein [Lachnospiraceae bacterium]|nr:histidinol-phosphatase HisJ family protein [Lachnospiraceae bacterium]